MESVLKGVCLGSGMGSLEDLYSTATMYATSVRDFQSHVRLFPYTSTDTNALDRAIKKCHLCLFPRY
jgi:hypothetical protein